MSDTTATLDQTELATDAQFSDTLERVSFQPGIMLGAQAMNDEQSYHVRRLSRHQRWLIGPGTVFGLRVDVLTPAPVDDPTDVRLTVQPGYAIDGLGREVLVPETYAISLRDWLATQYAAGQASNTSPLAGFYSATDTTAGTLCLRVTVRAQATPTALQPVVAELFDAGLDPVVPARISDSFLLEVTGASTTATDVPPGPLDWWAPGRATPSAADMPGPLVTQREQTMLAGLPANAAGALNIQAWLLTQPLPAFDDSPGAASGYGESARLLLASVHVPLTALNPPSPGPAPSPTINGTTVNNLVRPFVTPNALLTALTLP